jgi:hypothetical protein
MDGTTLNDTSLEQRAKAAISILRQGLADPYVVLSYVIWPDNPPPLTVGRAVGDTSGVEVEKEVKEEDVPEADCYAGVGSASHSR